MGAHLIHPLPDEPWIHILSEYLVTVERDDGWGTHLIHPLPDEPGIHVLGEYLEEICLCWLG